MALTLAASISNTITSITALDTTGIYNAVTNSVYYNLTGWNGGGNGNISAATAATLAITSPDPVTFLATTTPVVINVHDVLPNVLMVKKVIPAADYRQTTNIDGVYYFTYSVVITSIGTKTYGVYKLFDHNVSCCVEQLARMGACDKSAMKKYSEAYDILQVMRFLARCGSTDLAIVELKKLKRICRECGCCDNC